MYTYRIPENVSLLTDKSYPILSNSKGGKVILDRRMLELWQIAAGRQQDEILTDYHVGKQSRAHPAQILAALACLAEASLLVRDGYTGELTEKPDLVAGTVSVILVSHNNLRWLDDCLRSIFVQIHPVAEIILVDNASTDGTREWLTNHYPQIQLIQLEQAHSLAGALNAGIQCAMGDYYLLLNPDVVLEPTALAHMVSKTKEHPDCAAVTAKLKFMWTPAFLNGLGNHVGMFSWGTDNALGHLDLGQFDHWDEVPSACFAATLITASLWAKVGPIDEHFPLYYEDIEWCYRARLMGYKVYAASKSIVYHAFSGNIPSNHESNLPPRKLRQVTYGRLRFSTKLLSPKYLMRFMLSYLLEDMVRFTIALFSLRWQINKVYIQAWQDYLRTLPELLVERKKIQAVSLCSDKDIFELQDEIPPPLVRQGLPLLTWDVVLHNYLPYIFSKSTRLLPEFNNQSYDFQDLIMKTPAYKRILEILRDEGLSALIHRVGKFLQWRFARP